MLRLAPLSFYNLDAAYTLRKVFEGRLAGLGRVHICSASLLVFRTSQPYTTQEAEERRAQPGPGEGEEGRPGAEELCASPSTMRLEANANLGMLDTGEFPGSFPGFLKKI